MQKIYNTGRIPLWLRLPLPVIGLFALWMAANSAGGQIFHIDLGLSLNQERSSLAGFVIYAGLGCFLISAWFIRTQFYYLPEKHTLLMRGTFGLTSRELALEDAKAVEIQKVVDGMTNCWNLSVIYDDGRKEWLTRVYRKTHADEAASLFSDVLKLPVSEARDIYYLWSGSRSFPPDSK